jgi:hypothetical protein
MVYDEGMEELKCACKRLVDRGEKENVESRIESYD